MPLVVETGEIVTGANSYVSLADADAYLADSLNFPTWDALSEDEKERLLISSTRWLDQRTKWSGTIIGAVQKLRWPRTGAVDCDDLPMAEDEVPQRVKDAVCELACFLATPENNPTRYSDTTGFSELTVDVITLKFQEGYNPNAQRFLPGLNDILCGLGRVSSSSGRGFAPIQRV